MATGWIECLGLLVIRPSWGTFPSSLSRCSTPRGTRPSAALTSSTSIHCKRASDFMQLFTVSQWCKLSRKPSALQSRWAFGPSGSMIRIGCSRWHSHNDERGNSSPTVTQSQKYRYSKSSASRAGNADTFMAKHLLSAKAMDGLVTYI